MRGDAVCFCRKKLEAHSRKFGCEFPVAPSHHACPAHIDGYMSGARVGSTTPKSNQRKAHLVVPPSTTNS